MKENIFENKKTSRVETIKGPNGNEASFCLERGGIINSIILNGKEILYLDEETFKDSETNVRGGVPILFPNAGPLKENSLYPDLPRHGFARKMKWQRGERQNGFKEILLSNEETKKIYPYAFLFSMTGIFEKDGSLTLINEVENKKKILRCQFRWVFIHILKFLIVKKTILSLILRVESR